MNFHSDHLLNTIINQGSLVIERSKGFNICLLISVDMCVTVLGYKCILEP
jgi:hypothetical protein